MADDLVFYTNPAYRTELLDYATTMKAAAYRAINPMGKVPAIRHGDTIVTECAAICAYLADAFPQAALAPPPGDRRRGPYYRWMFFAAGPLEAALSNTVLGFVVPEGRERMMGYGTLAETLDALEGAVSQGPYLSGDSFTAADLYVGAHINFGLQFGTLEKRPAFVGYGEHLAKRPAAVRAREIDDALMAQKQ
jgi:glutathione S-transferase